MIGAVTSNKTLYLGISHERKFFHELPIHALSYSGEEGFIWGMEEKWFALFAVLK